MKIKNPFYVVIGLLLLILILVGCSNNKFIKDTCEGITCSVVANTNEVNIEKLEIYHFHATRQCYSCITLGDYAEETVNTYFSDELNSGKIVFGHINGDLSENKELVIKYSATGSSLWIGIYYKDGSFVKEENVNVWYKIGDKGDYMNYLKGIIEQKLAGN